MQLINGTAIAEIIYDQLKSDIATLKAPPKLTIILASEDEASKTYTRMKTAKAVDLGIGVELVTFKQGVKPEEIVLKLKELNEKQEVNGILVQLPLFKELKEFQHPILNTINPLKDPDGLTAVNLGLITQSFMNGIIPATVDAILECIKFAKINVTGKEILIINNTDLIGKPLAGILATLNATVTIVNKFTHNLGDYTQSADVIISATGQTDLINASMIKEHALLIDVTSKNVDGKVKGDFVRNDELDAKADFITPVPGGIGPLTIACLLRNLVKLSKLQASGKSE